MPRLALTPGDPRGIGPEVLAGALERLVPDDPPVRLRLLSPDEVEPDPSAARSSFEPRLAPAEAGRRAAAALERAVELALAGEVEGIVTGPVHKPSLRLAGWEHPGQTEYLGERTGSGAVGMLMAAERTRLDGPLRVLLATTHLPLRRVTEVLSVETFVEQGRLLHRSLRSDWGLPDPSLALCAVNPHASDAGLFGDEEERLQEPAVERLRSEGVRIEGPVPADTVFVRALEGDFDAVVAPYHDVGMAAFKTVTFGAGVNVTLGLPFVRTSPDHGTAFDRAGRGRADPSSTLEAIRLAARLATHRKTGASS